MSSGRKSICLYYSTAVPKPILRCRIFGSRPDWRQEATVCASTGFCDARFDGRSEPDLPAAELAARRRTTRSSTTPWTLVLVAEDQPPFFQIIGRHLDRHPVARQRFVAVVFIL